MKNQFNPDIDYSATDDCSHANPFIALRNNCTIKVSKKLAKQILLYDITVVRLGVVRYLQLMDVGLGVYEVRLIPEKVTTWYSPPSCNMLVTSILY